MKYVVEKADIAKDKDCVLKFWNAFHERPLDRKYSWLYENNPSGKAHVWLLRHQGSGELVGMAGLFPRWVWLQGEKKLAVIAGDFFVHEQHRTVGPALTLQKSVVAAVGKDVAVLAYSFPNRLAEAIMKRVGYRPIGELQRWVKITRTAPHFIRRGVPRPLASLIGSFLDLGMRLQSMTHRFCRCKQYRCEDTDRIDERFDRLWESDPAEYQFIGVRNMDYLRWKFLQDPDDDHRFFSIEDRKRDTLLGYLVYCRRGERIEIRDAFFPRNQNAMENLIRNFLKLTYAWPTDSIEINMLSKNRHAYEVFQRFGFRNRGPTRGVFMYFPKEMPRKKLVTALGKSCFVTKGDEET